MRTERPGVLATKTAKKKRPADKQHASWKGKTPSERQRSEREALQSGASVGFATVSVKLRPEEKAELKRVCDRLGLTPNRAMRIMARRSSGFLELDNQSLEHLEIITQQIIGVSRNINQIAKAANRTRSPDYIAFMEDRAALSKELRSLQRVLQSVTNTARRRTDGLAPLKEAAETS